MLQLDPIWQPDIQQRQFRQLLDVMSRPGCCRPLQTTPAEGPAALVVLASLLDGAVSLADPDNLLRAQDWPMLQVQAASPEQADFILCDASSVPDFTPRLGTLPSPEQSATLILVVTELGRGEGRLQLSGPGIAGIEYLAVAGLAEEWITLRNAWVSAFPLGVDIILLDGRHVAALPRTTRVEVV